MAFPISPTTGQIAVVDGISYVYSATTNSWKRQSFSITDININTGIDATQNTRISSTDNTATAAYAKANAAFDKANTGGSGSSSGYLANSVIIANTTGYLTNTSALLYYTSNNNLVKKSTCIGSLFSKKPSQNPLKNIFIIVMHFIYKYPLYIHFL